MKYFISHRGNINGRKSEMENHPEYIMAALREGYDVEIDIWVIDGAIFLGHDAPQYEISIDFLFNNKLWCHAKNFAALTMLVDNKDKIHFFSHDSDHHILTSRGIIWAYVGKEIDENTICVMPELSETPYTKHDFAKCLGICSDDIQRYRILYGV